MKHLHFMYFGHTTLFALCMLVYTYSIAQNQDKKTPNPSALREATDYWESTLTKHQIVKNNNNKDKKALGNEIKNMVTIRNNEANGTRKIRTTDEYIAIFTIQWDDTIRLKDGKKFKNKYPNLYNYAKEIQKIINQDSLRQKLEMEGEENEVKTAKVDTIEEKTNPKQIEQEKKKDGEVPFITWVALALSIILPVVVFFILQRKTQQNIQNSTERTKEKINNLDTEIQKITQNLNPLKDEITKINKITIDLNEIRNQIAQQSLNETQNSQSKSVFAVNTYYFGTSAIEDNCLLQKYSINSYDENACYIVEAEGETGRFDIVKDNKVLIIKHQDRILKPGLVEKIGWKETQDNVFSHTEPGKVELRGDKWVIIQKIRIYFNQ